MVGCPERIDADLFGSISGLSCKFPRMQWEHKADLHGCCSGLFRFSGRIDNPFALSELNGAAIAMSRPVLSCRCCAVAVETARTLASFPSPRRKRRESLYIGSRFPQSISAGLRRQSNLCVGRILDTAETTDVMRPAWRTRAHYQRPESVVRLPRRRTRRCADRACGAGSRHARGPRVGIASCRPFAERAAAVNSSIQEEPMERFVAIAVELACGLLCGRR